jgi:hypothetical protein
LEVGSARGFRAEGNSRDNIIRLYHNIGISSGSIVNHVIFPIAPDANTFTATLIPLTNDALEVVYRIYADGQALYTSPILRGNVAPIPVEIDIRGFSQLRLESEVIHDGRRYWLAYPSDGGIANATILTTDY